MPPKKKAIKRRAWTPEDVKEVKSMAKAKTNTKSHSLSKEVLGVTSDGVRILKQKPSTNFSQRQLRTAIARARSGDG